MGDSLTIEIVPGELLAEFGDLRSIDAMTTSTEIRRCLSHYGVRVMPRPYFEQRHLAYEPAALNRPDGIFIDFGRKLWHANVDGAHWRPLTSLLEQLAAAAGDNVANVVPGPAPSMFLAECEAAGIKVTSSFAPGLYWGHYAGELVLLYCDSRLIGLPGGRTVTLDGLTPAAPQLTHQVDRPSPRATNRVASTRSTTPPRQLSLF